MWKHEALDFTTWLEGNVDVLNDALDLAPERGANRTPARLMSIVAEDQAGKFVIIENRFEKQP